MTATLAEASLPARTTSAPGGWRRPALAAGLVAVLGTAAVFGVALADRHPHTTYQGRTTESLLVGTVAAPALQSQGVPVKVMLPGGSALATITGPETPGQGLPYQADYTTTTWTVHITAATTAVPLALRDFDTLDHGGVVGHPYVVPHTPAPPAVLAKGRSVTFQVREDMAVGEGLLRYAPDGNHIEAKWDFEVEND